VSKPFEITYAPSQWDAPPGGIAQAWSVPYGGLNVQFPENQIGPNFTPAMNNCTFRNAELRSRPAFQFFLPGPDGSNPILGVASFLSANLIWHTVAFTVNGLFQLVPNAQDALRAGRNPWTPLGGPQLSSGNPVAWRTFQSVFYYTNGSGHLSAWDGAVLTPITDVAFTGTTPPSAGNYTGTILSSLFLGELSGNMIMAYTQETAYASGLATGTSTYPQRLRWSNVNFNPTTAGSTFGSNLGTGGATFDPTVNVNAGFNDFLDVPDVITGLLFLGRVGYVFRSNGITEMDPTGVGTAPFDFNHLWASEQGIGNVYPTSIAQYGSYGVFVAQNNVYQITPGNVVPIGAGARDAIMQDLSNTNGSPSGVIVPRYSVYRVCLVYKLFIPLSNGSTRVYVYSFDDNNWASWTLTGVSVGQPNGCWIGDPATVYAGSSVVTSGSNTTLTTGGGGGGGGVVGGRGQGGTKPLP
jgi:hypothetical protein